MSRPELTFHQARARAADKADMVLIDMIRRRSDRRERTWLYRFFDADGRLLYVGVTKNRDHRLAQHRRNSPWWSQAVDLRLDLFACRLDATCAETLAIRQESPLHNRAVSSRAWGFEYARPAIATIWTEA